MSRFLVLFPFFLDSLGKCYSVEINGQAQDSGIDWYYVEALFFVNELQIMSLFWEVVSLHISYLLNLYTDIDFERIGPFEVGMMLNV